MKQRIKGKHIKINPKNTVNEEAPVKKIILSPAQLEEYAELEKEEKRLSRAYNKLNKEYISMEPAFASETENILTELHTITSQLEKIRLANGYHMHESSAKVAETLSSLNPKFQELTAKKQELEKKYAEMYKSYTSAKTEIIEKLSDLQANHKPIKARLEQLKQ